MRRFATFGPAFVVILTGLAAILVLPGMMREVAASHSRANVSYARAALDSDDILERFNNAIRAVSVAVEPSVVHIEVITTGRREGWFSGASGSGWIWDEQGHVITNSHVIAGATMIRVHTFDGRVRRAEVVGADPLADVAVLKIEADGTLVPAVRATGLRPQQGDRVFAFGSPFGFKFSMSEGIVSGLGRTARSAFGAAGLSNYIQTDAAVNPGNSGGPLADIHGRVIGMNVAIATAQNTGGTSEGQSAGISFAIPLAMVESRVSRIIAGQPIASGFLGITFAAGESFHGAEDATPGVRVEDLQADSPAAFAGIKVDDIITHIDSQPVMNGDTLRGIIGAMRPGEQVQLDLMRGNQKLAVTVTLGELPRDAVARTYRRVLFERFGVDLDEQSGTVFIRRVTRESPAQESGLKSGDRLLSVEGQRVTSVDDAVLKLNDQGLFIGRAIDVTVASRVATAAAIAPGTEPEQPDAQAGEADAPSPSADAGERHVTLRLYR